MPSGDYNELYYLEQQSQANRELSTMPEIIDTDPTLAANSDAKISTQKAVKIYVDERTGGSVLLASQLDTDGTLAANSDAKITSQKAIKTYADTKALKVGGNLYATSNTDLAIDVLNRRLKSSDGVTVLDWGHTTDGGNLLNVVFGDGTLTPGNTWGVRINTAGISTVDGDFAGATFSVDAVTGNVTTVGQYHGNGSALNLGYKIYRATLSQAGTAAPVATVLQNTLGGTVVWSRFQAGGYAATLAGAFPSAKTFAMISGVADQDGSENADVNAPNQVVVQTFSGSTGADDLLGNTAIEILVYP